MHVKEIYIFIHLFDSGINVMFRQFKEKNKNLLRLKLKSALKIEQISVVL
jgi:NhaP-type Na+/H+ or K+/H+ antiporter